MTEVVDMLVRTMSKTDLDEVLSIERSAYHFPWGRGVFESCFRDGYQASVLESEDGIVGYGIVLAVMEEGHVLNFCIAKEHQRQGNGVFLLREILDRAIKGGVKQFVIEVRPSNLPALSLYKKQGFRQVGLRKGYYPARGQQREDALVLTYQLA